MKPIADSEKPPLPLKRLRFTFPLRKKAKKEGRPGVDITDEHEFHRLLRREPRGAFAVSAKGMWHGGIHITESGAGRFLDLNGGVLAMADGEVVAWRLNRTYPVAQLPGDGQRPEVRASYSTGFALVRHRMEFPRGTWLIFYSLYMHLQDLAGYEAQKALSRPGHWSPEFKVTTFARDQQRTKPGMRAAPAEKRGLRVRTARGGGKPLCIVPQGARFRIGERKGNWGKIIGSEPVIPANVGDFAAPDAAVGGWVFLGQENGGSVVEEVMPDAVLDCVVVPPKPIEVKAGQLLGHLGRYDSLDDTAPTRMVHIEMFCGDGIKGFLESGRAWIREHCFYPRRWKALGLPSDPTLLRIDRRTKLYKAPYQEGRDAPHTDVVQVLSLAVLGRGKENRIAETTPGTDSLALNWWKVVSANMLGNEISGWVREQNFAGGRVTREFAQKWVDFQTIEGAHDPAHTLCGVSRAYVEYACNKDMPAVSGFDKLSPLMQSVYRETCPGGNRNQAADELCVASKDPWQSLRASRLIIRHESEWANAGKWKHLIAELENATAPEKQNEAEQRRIEKLVWWEEVKALVPDLPGPTVFHMHPAAVVGNFFIDMRLQDFVRRIGDIIAHGEGNYESYNTGTIDYKVVHSFLNPPPGTITTKTIDTILEKARLHPSDVDRIFAAGKYQVIASTLAMGKLALKLKGNEVFDGEMQEFFFSEFLFEKAGKGGLAGFVRKGIGSVDDAQFAASQEWASIAAPKGRVRWGKGVSDGTQSYYDEPPNFANPESTRMLRQVLEEVSEYWKE